MFYRYAASVYNWPLPVENSTAVQHDVDGILEEIT
jgi:hypothetical protein